MVYKNPDDPRRLLSGQRHYQKNKEKYIQHALDAKKRLREYVRQRKNQGCTDCHKKYPYYVMQFDHLNDKEYNIGTLVNLNNRGKLEAELAKCEVVCANCHAERTHQRGIVQRLVHRSPKPRIVVRFHVPLPRKITELSVIFRLSLITL
jgi:5-methylcytosine-specific restriction endonuclease McrA